MRNLHFVVMLQCSMVGCGAAGLQLPSAGFHQLQINAVQPDVVARRLELDVTVVFRVSNPLPIALRVPRHKYALKVGTSTAVGETTAELVVESGKVAFQPYRFHLDLRDLQQLLGDDKVPLEFRAEVEVDLPAKLKQQLDALPGTPVPPGVTDVAAWAAKTGLPAQLQKGRITLVHEEQIKLPLLPELRPSQSLPVVRLLGPTTTVSIAAALDAAKALLQPFLTLLGDLLARAPTFTPQYSVVELLRKAGVPEGSLNTVMNIITTAVQGRTRGTLVPMSSLTLPSVMSLMDQVDPEPDASKKASRRWAEFQTAWASFPPPELRQAVLPTSLPDGLHVELPLRLRNPNRFAMVVPSFRVSLKRGGDVIAHLEAAPIGSVGAEAEAEVRLVGEVYWKQAPQTPLQLVGELTVDSGYGVVTVPFDVTRN